MFEEAEDDAEEDDHKIIDKEKYSEETKPAKSFDVEDLSAEDIEDAIEKCNEKHPEGGIFVGLFKHVSTIETKIDEKEKEIDNSEITILLC